MSDNLLVNYSENDTAVTSSELSLTIEQVVPNKIEKYATIHDLYKAWLLSASGISARKNRLNGCPIEFDGTLVRFFLGFYVWSSDPKMEYSLQAPVGIIGPGISVKVSKVIYDFMDNQSDYVLPYFMQDMEVEWTTDTFNRISQPISSPGHTQKGKVLYFDSEVFGEAEISGKAVGEYYVLTIEIDKEAWIPAEDPEQATPSDSGDVIITEISPDALNSFSVENLAVSVTGIWVDSTGKTQTYSKDFEIPECVKAILEFCPGDEIMYYLSWCEESSDRQVYFSDCDGEVLEVWDGLNPRDYCTKIAMENDPGPWLRTLR